EGKPNPPVTQVKLDKRGFTFLRLRWTPQVCALLRAERFQHAANARGNTQEQRRPAFRPGERPRRTAQPGRRTGKEPDDDLADERPAERSHGKGSRRERWALSPTGHSSEMNRSRGHGD